MQVTSTHVPQHPDPTATPTPTRASTSEHTAQSMSPNKIENAYSHASRPLPSDLSSPKNRL